MRHKVFTDRFSRLVYRAGPGDYRYVDRTQMDQGAQLKIDQALLDQLAGMGASGAELDLVADLSALLQELTVTADGPVRLTARFVELKHDSDAIEVTLAAPPLNAFMFVKNTSGDGTAAHKITLTGGTWDGANDIATLNLPGKCAVIYFDSAGDGVVVENIDVGEGEMVDFTSS